MALEDRYGLPLSTSSPEAASAYREGVDLMLAGWTGTAEALERAIAADPDFALAHIARARVHTFYQQGDLARQKAALARELVREARHGARALACRDAGACDRGQAARGDRGDAEARRRVAARCHWCCRCRSARSACSRSPAWPITTARGRSCASASRIIMARIGGFSPCTAGRMTENGNFSRGRGVTERGFELRRQNAHAAHAVLHAMFEDGSIEAADRLVDDWIPTLTTAPGILHGHIRWHQALGALEHGDAARALAIYADVLQPKATQAPPLNAVTDGASLLWRCRLTATPCRERSGSKPMPPRKSFSEIEPALCRRPHGAVCSCDAKSGEALAARLAVIEQRLADGKLPAGPVVPAVCRALGAFADEQLRGVRANARAGPQRGRAHRRQPCPARVDRGHLYRRPDAQRRAAARPRPARRPPAPPPILARYALAGGYGLAPPRKKHRPDGKCRPGMGWAIWANRRWVARWYFRRIRQNKRDRNQFAVRWLSGGTFPWPPGM